MNWIKAFTATVGLAAASTSCSGSKDTTDGSELGRVQQAVGLPSGGFIPYPVMKQDGNVVLQADGVTPTTSWDGTLAELMAADAYVGCMTTSSHYVGASSSTNAAGTDEFYLFLRQEMEKSVCEPGNPVEGKWLSGRADSSCNIDTTTRLPAAVAFPNREIPSYLTFPQEFRQNWDDYVSAPNSGAGISAAEQASQALSYAELNLCVAQRLQEQRNSASILFASDEDHLQLMGFVRERAQLAVLQYALLAKVLAAPGPIPTHINSQHEFLPLLRHWANLSAAADAMAVLGEDFATAVRVHLDATYEFAELLRRQASARPTKSDFATRAEADWAEFTPRVRLLNLLYGGDPLTTSDTPGLARGAGGRPLKDLPFVKADMRSPEISTLLGLARHADQLKLKLTVAPTDSNVTTGVDVPASVLALYTNVESFLRQRDCEIRSAPTCPEADTLDSIGQFGEYILWNRHRITPSHATDLIEALAQAAGTLAATPLDGDPGTEGGYGFGVGVFHFTGQHETEIIDNEPWLHFDRGVDIRAFSAHEIGSRFDGGSVIPASIRLDVNAPQQGFLITNTVNPPFPFFVSNYSDDHYGDRRDMGATQALTLAREAILQGNNATGNLAAFFEPARAVLEVVEKAIGPTQALIRPAMVTTDAASCSQFIEASGPCKALQEDRSGNSVKYHVDVVTNEADPFDRLASGQYVYGMETAALDASSQSHHGTSRAELDALDEATSSNSTFGADVERRRFVVENELTAGNPGGGECPGFIEQLSNGDMSFAVTFPTQQSYVEAFIQIEGTQYTNGNIVSSEVENPDGTFTYKRIMNTQGSFCGDDTCNNGETCSTCAADCGPCTSSACFKLMAERDDRWIQTVSGKPEMVLSATSSTAHIYVRHDLGSGTVKWQDEATGNYFRADSTGDQVFADANAGSASIWTEYNCSSGGTYPNGHGYKSAGGTAPHWKSNNGTSAGPISTWDLGNGTSCVSGSANSWERFYTVPTTCAVPVCGDGVCGGTETCSSCLSDCGTCASGCGGSTCNFNPGDEVKVRFYSHRSGPGVFTPGPGPGVWSETFEYGESSCEDEPSTPSSSGPSIVLLKNAAPTGNEYIPLNALPSRTGGAFYLSLSGNLNAIAKRAWTVRSGDWSQPSLDAFDLPTDWVPPADASLVGGVSGEESYQYFLRTARDAAEEATRAVQTAIDNLVEETNDEVALANSDQRAAEIGKIEERALCGAAESCDLALVEWRPEVVSRCQELDPGPSRELCEEMEFQFTASPTVALPAAVVGQRFHVQPDFSAFGGGELERILTNQWVAVTNIYQAIETAQDTILAMVARVEEADARLLEVATNTAAARAEMHTRIAALEASAEAELQQAGAAARGLLEQRDGLFADSELLEQQKRWQCCDDVSLGTMASEIESSYWAYKDSGEPIVWAAHTGTIQVIDEVAYAAQLAASGGLSAFSIPTFALTENCDTILKQRGLEKAVHCVANDLSDEGRQVENRTGQNCRGQASCGMVEAVCSSYSLSGESLGVGINLETNVIEATPGWQNISFSVGPKYSAESECRRLMQKLERENERATEEGDALTQQAVAQLNTALVASQEAAATAETAILADLALQHDVIAAGATKSATRAGIFSEFGSQLNLLQQAYGELVRSSTELSTALGRKDVATARAELESSLLESEIEARSGVTKKFRSYDLWRARALLEAARRMAVAARRSIESRFTVDLSELQASQVFVEAPSIWADEIYDNDLSAPSAVGLEVTPSGGDGVFPNKLIDYVGNLERFVQGYTVAYPTSVASPDTEVVALPGPDERVDDEVLTEDESVNVIQHVAPSSAGWSFFCENSETWISHPGLLEYPIGSLLDTACDGQPPTRARYMFWLNPWGGLREDIASVPYTERHNARWRRLAVNLVGTGIRDCERAIDPVACYSDSFIRYDVTHIGPAWVTDHSQQWRSYDIPRGSIEGAKALSTEEWLDPVSNSWNEPFVANVARGEFLGRPIGGDYEIVLELTPDIRLERIERVQILAETDYWVRQN